MFSRSAEIYDTVYSFKDYAAEAERVNELIQSRRPGAASLLDVACGTGKHLEQLRRWYAVEGVDLDRRRGDAEDAPLLPDPGRVPLDVAAEPPEEDAFERGPLVVVSSLVDVEEHAPRRPGLVVVVANGEHDAETVEAVRAGPAVLDQP